HRGELLHHQSSSTGVLRVAHLVGDEVFIQCEAVRGSKARENSCGFVGSTRRNIFPARDQNSVGEILIDGLSSFQILNRPEVQTGRLDRRRRGGNPTRTVIEETLRV